MVVSARKLLVAIVLLAALGAGAVVLFVQSGFYDIAATEQHTRGVFTLMDYAMRRSVKARVEGIEVPDLSDEARVRRGAAHYRAHCLQCHGAPGVAPEPFAFGMTPAPANLVGTAREWRDDEMFWVVRHGIKMTGMPAWVYRLEDDEIWDVIAFVRASVSMTAAQYAAMAASLPPHRHAAKAPSQAPAMRAGTGDAEAGRQAAQRYLCATCHVIPGMVSADRHVGPPLVGIGRRAYIGGVLANTPDNMVRWLKDPRQVDPLSTMPALGLGDEDARDIAAFLATLDDLAAR